MVLGKLPVPGRPTLWMIVGQGPIALAVTLIHLNIPTALKLEQASQTSYSESPLSCIYNVCNLGSIFGYSIKNFKH